MCEEKEIFDHLLEIGCCKYCCIRYLCNKYIDLNSTDEYAETNGFLRSQESDSDSDDQLPKKVKQNPCIACLGVLHDSFITSIICSELLLRDVLHYDSPVFSCSISLPACVLLREHSMRLYLEDKFPKKFTEENQELPLSKAWKILIKDRLQAAVSKKFQNSDICDFFINVCVDYEDNLKELEVLKQLQPIVFETRQEQRKKKYGGELFSRKSVVAAVEGTTSGVYKMHVPIPPRVPSTSVTCKSVECKHNPIYFAARYCKYSRELSQTPWLINGVKMMETSVQEIIFEHLEKVFGIYQGSLKFSSSGREDCDVRCLGKGRPFYIEVLNPKKSQVTFEDFRKLEREINKSPLLSVRDFQIVHRSELTSIKDGEESKTKSYNALCVAKGPITQEITFKINSTSTFQINQKTPIRVLHRRPLADRPKTIYEMKATAVPNRDNMFELEIITQAGTYVKEFIHGDFGRTKPSLGDIIGMEVDIITLDVTAINLDWPPEISDD